MDGITYKKLENFASKRKCTLIGIGPMSKNSVDVVIELANEFDVPLMIIASRRQIEASCFGGGYVNNWSTESFSEYVKNNDKKENVILCRDHGGPWQNDKEKESKINLDRAIDAAKKSYEVDIKSGFELIHIDPTTDVYGNISLDKTLERLYLLYEYCWSVAKRQNKEIAFEVSVGKEDGGVHTPNEIESVILKLNEFCIKKNLPKPFFLVIRTGNYVMETKNVGNFENFTTNKQNSSKRENILKIIEICNAHNIKIKEHNTDYLSDEALTLHPKLGIHAANIAPEIGVTETRAFLKLLEENNLVEEKKQFIDLAYSSKKWQKWMLPNTNCAKIEKAIIAGHYVFSSLEFVKIKNIVQNKIKNIDVDSYLKEQIRSSILRYMKLFNLI